ncbi:MAG: KR domain-containing protein [Hydrococcus sp. RM1_1_31]|nr:KR domain-containing protein [Hydrococcus sp. RM1_1_31]
MTNCKKIINQLETAGANIHVKQADISKQDDIIRIIPPSLKLRGIIHAAGILDDGVLMQQNWERFEKVLTPKIQGAWNLHLATQNYSLDFFVLFSSAASLIGSAGQANYCAANAFLDAFAHYRQGLGLPALSINWGAWSNVGMAAKLEQKQMRSRQNKD